jgi:NADP-dependent 3-hydroxy acid dehydrogenase YdfG
MVLELLGSQDLCAGVMTEFLDIKGEAESMANNIETKNNTSTTPSGLLVGKVIFITGASRGIGAAAARLFAEEGAAVVLAARSTDALERIAKEIRTGGGAADAVTLDLADRASIRAAVDQVEKLHGRLDGAFNNGGVNQQPGPLGTTSEQHHRDRRGELGP